MRQADSKREHPPTLIAMGGNSLGDPARPPMKLPAPAIVDPVWRQSYLSRNPHCAAALRLASSWGLAAATRSA